MERENREYDDYTEVPTVLLLQAIGCLSADARRYYRNNSTKVADMRHGTGRALTDSLDVKWTDVPDILGGVDGDLMELLED